jgi:hypothetical protein
MNAVLIIFLFIFIFGCTSIKRCPTSETEKPGKPNTEQCIENLKPDEKQAQTSPLMPYATPSVFRHIPNTELVIQFLRLAPTEADVFARDVKNAEFMSNFKLALKQIKLIAALHGKTIYHFLAERGEAQAIVYLYRDTYNIWKTQKRPEYCPVCRDLNGIPPSGYALNNLHLEAYGHLTNLERLHDGVQSERLIFSALDITQPATQTLPAKIKAVTDQIFLYYQLVDKTGDQTDTEVSRKKALEDMYALFSAEIIYARNNNDIYDGIGKFKDFYERIRDIEGQHDQLIIKTLKQISEEYIYIATRGRFRGKLKSNGKPIEAYFFDHFIYDLKTGLFIRRMSDIDSKI